MYRTKLLVVANQTVDSDELYDALHERAERGPLAVTLLVPQDQQEGLGPARQPRRSSGCTPTGIEAEAMLGRRRPGVRGDRVLGSAALGRGRRLDAADRHLALAADRPAAPHPPGGRRARPPHRDPAGAAARDGLGHELDQPRVAARRVDARQRRRQRAALGDDHARRLARVTAV